MSEPTYRVDLEHHPEKDPYSWHAIVSRISDEMEIQLLVGQCRDEAFDRAQWWLRAFITRSQQPPSTVYLSEAGDLLDPHEVQIPSVYGGSWSVDDVDVFGEDLA